MLVAAAVVLSASAEPPTDGKGPSTSRRDGKASRRARPATSSRAVDPLEAVRALRIVIPKAEFDEVPLDEFVDWLSRETKVNVVVRWKLLERAGIERTAPITLSVRDSSIAAILQAVLKQAAAGHAELGFRATDNIITLSTRTDLNRLLVTATYDVKDLLVLVPDFESMRPDGIGLGLQQRETLRGSVKDADAAVVELIEVIVMAVYPDSWRVNGGLGTISHFRGRLVVRNTPEVHQALRGQLRALRN